MTPASWWAVMVLSVFGDESSDETRQRVFAVSGLFGLESEWQQAEAAWTAITGGEIFHAADWEYARRKSEYEALVRVLTTSPIGGVVYAIDLVAFNECYPGLLRESAYLKCFSKVVIDTASTASKFNAQSNAPITQVEFTFDNRRESNFSASRAYDSFIHEPGWESALLLASKVSFESRTNPRIQMADMIAREGMKDLDRVVGPVKFRERTSKIELVQSERFRFFAYGKEYFEREREQARELETDGFNEVAYHEWLRRKGAKGAQDTVDNRVRFLEYLDKKKSR